MSRNPLDPDAWLTEEHRFDMPGERADIRLGVHAADSTAAAIAYGVHKASQEGELPGGEPNCGILFELDLAGLDPLPEGDAPVAAEHEDAVISEMQNYPEIVLGVETRDSERLAEGVLDFIESAREGDYGDGEYHDTWFMAFWNQDVREEGPWVILGPLGWLAENDPQDLLLVMTDAFERGTGFPLDLWAQAIGQYRYMAPVGMDRLLRVSAIHPVEPGLVDFPEDEDEEEGPTVFSQDWVGAPDTELLWDSGRTVSGTMYHGTDLKRARLAFPELEDVLVCPWDYGQPEGVGPA